MRRKVDEAIEPSALYGLSTLCARARKGQKLRMDGKAIIGTYRLSNIRSADGRGRGLHRECTQDEQNDKLERLLRPCIDLHGKSMKPKNVSHTLLPIPCWTQELVPPAFCLSLTLLPSSDFSSVRGGADHKSNDIK